MVRRDEQKKLNMKPQDRIDHRDIFLIIIYFFISLVLQKMTQNYY